MRTPREPLRGSSDLRSHLVAMLLLLRKKRGKTGHAQNILPAMTVSGQGHFRSRDFVTSGQKAPLGRRNFRLRMRRTYFWTGHVTDVTSGHVTDVTSGHVTDVTSGHVTSCSTPSQHPFKCGFVRTHILLALLDLLFYMYVLEIVVCPFVLFLLAIVVYVLLRYTYSDYPFSIIKLLSPPKKEYNCHNNVDCFWFTSKKKLFKRLVSYSCFWIFDDLNELVVCAVLQNIASILFFLNEKASQLNNCYNSIHCNFLFVNN
jgi:hypothetical protein